MHSFSKRNQSLLNHSVLLFVDFYQKSKVLVIYQRRFKPKALQLQRVPFIIDLRCKSPAKRRSLRSIGSELRAHHASCLFLPTIMQLCYSLTPRDLLGLLYPQNYVRSFIRSITMNLMIHLLALAIALPPTSVYTILQCGSFTSNVYRLQILLLRRS